MDVFWICFLTIFMVFHHTFFGPWPPLPADGLSNESSVRDGTIMAAPAGVSDLEVTKFECRNITLIISIREVKPTIWYLNKTPIATVNSAGVHFHQKKFEPLFAISEDGCVLTILQPGMELAGTYSAKGNGETYIFTIQWSGSTVVCKVQNCSRQCCTCCPSCSAPNGTVGEDLRCVRSIPCPLDQLRGEGPVLQGKESSGKELEPVKGTAKSPISNRSITITTPVVLLNGNTTHPPSPGADSGSWIIPLIVVVVLFVVCPVVVVVYFCKSRDECGKASLEPWAAGVPCLKGKLSGRAGSQGYSRGAAGNSGDDIEMQDMENV